MSDDNQAGAEVSGALMAPGVAASELGVSGAALRRMAASYERVFGQLPEGGSGRLWPSEAVERLHDARQLLAANRARSVQAALELLREGITLPSEAPPALARDDGTQDAVLLELRALRGEVEAMRSELATMRALPEAEAMSERAGERSADGALVRLARRLERMLGRR